MSKALAIELQARLEAEADTERATNEAWYLKSPPEITHIGVKVPVIRKITRALIREQSEFDHDTMVRLVNELWSSSVYECRKAAIEVLNASAKLLVADDVKLVEKLADDSFTWAYVDDLAIRTMGALIDRFPELADVLDRWAEHPNFWLRRSALLAVMGSIRTDGSGFERFGRYADGMLHEQEFFIRKAIGWMLREASKKNPDIVYEWLAPRAHLCSMLTVREGAKYLDSSQRETIIAAARTKTPIDKLPVT